MKRRTVEIMLSEEFGTASGKAKRWEVSAAIGYLSQWGIGSDRYFKVRICGDSEGNLDAVYMNEAGEMTYQIGAILRDDGTYSFHS